MKTLSTSRKIAATSEQIYAAISTPKRLLKWWGPNGFTNIVELCDFQEGGHWKFVMRSAEGHEYPNECVFQKIVENREVVIRHIDQPLFTLTITLTELNGSTTVGWKQEFDDAEVAKKVEAIATKGNEENLLRLEQEVVGSRH